MTKDSLDISSLKGRLLEMRNELLTEVKNNAELSNEMGSDGVQDIGDISANTYNRQILLSLNDSQRAMLTDIDEALDRIKTGEYGICVECGDKISEKAKPGDKIKFDVELAARSRRGSMLISSSYLVKAMIIIPIGVAEYVALLIMFEKKFLIEVFAKD